MLFVILGNAKTGSTRRERIERRTNWQYPPGVRMVGEYWLLTGSPTMIAIVEASDVAPIMRGTADWDDVFDITVVPAVTAEQGLGWQKSWLCEPHTSCPDSLAMSDVWRTAPSGSASARNQPGLAMRRVLFHRPQ